MKLYTFYHASFRVQINCVSAEHAHIHTHTNTFKLSNQPTKTKRKNREQKPTKQKQTEHFIDTETIVVIFVTFLKDR